MAKPRRTRSHRSAGASTDCTRLPCSSDTVTAGISPAPRTGPPVVATGEPGSALLSVVDPGAAQPATMATLAASARPWYHFI